MPERAHCGWGGMRRPLATSPSGLGSYEIGVMRQRCHSRQPSSAATMAA